jgi:hypothetical protein
MTVNRWLMTSLCVALGCSGSPPAAKVDAAIQTNDTIDGPIGVDYGVGSWQVEQVSNTPGTISHNGTLTFLPDGTAIAGWMEADPVNVSDEDIETAIKSGSTWSGADRRTNDTNVQNSYPHLVTYAGVAHLVWGGYPGGDNDLFYAHYASSAWTARTDLTTPFETSPALRRDDRIPALAVSSSGVLAISYSSSTTNAMGNPNGLFEIRVIKLDGSGTVLGPPTTVIPAGTNGCGSSAIAFDGAGNLHVVADCGPLGAEDIYYATDESGSWTQMVVPGGAGRDDWGAKLASDPDGTTIHLTWTAFPTCTNNMNQTCADVMYRQIHPGATFGPEIDVTATGAQDEYSPEIGVDSMGRPLIAYHHANAQNFFDIYVTWSNDGQTFAPAQNITPGTDMRDDQQPQSLIFHPSTGLPHLVFYSTLSSNPLNTEIMHAEFIPSSI